MNTLSEPKGSSSLPVTGLGELTTDPGASEPLHRQLYRLLRQRILDGELHAGTRLPSSRTLAADLNLSRNTVVTAFEQLSCEGFIQMRVGQGTVVASGVSRPVETPKAPPTPALSELSISGRRLAHRHRSLPENLAGLVFQPGVPDVREFPRAAWARLATRRFKLLADGVDGYAHSGGFGPLRESLAAYLSASRGVRCGAHQILVTTTAQAALDLATRMLTDPGDGAWTEQPGYVGARASFEAHGLSVHAVDVDIDGAVVDQLKVEHKVGYVTPSHQFPTGRTLSLERRLALLEWARAANGWIFEDDYDSEFRYANRPVGAVQGLEPGGRVIYVGSFSKTLFPGLRVAYLVVPDGLAQDFRQALRQTGQEPPLAIQAALHDFIELGHFARHVRRMRGIYAGRRAAVVDALTRLARGLGQPLTADGGLQLTLQLNPGLDDKVLASAAREGGFGAEALSRYGLRPGAPGGLVLGVGNCQESTANRDVTALCALLEEHV
jgi:GntR family transcriptional regulator / MocR family aminotransferase